MVGADDVPPDRCRASAHVAARHRDAAIADRDLPTYIYDADTPRLLATPRHYAYVKIAEGCDYKCAFCIIPTLRGHYRSRPVESIVARSRALAARGVKELLLISQDTSFYGIDRGERGALARLLRALNGVDGIEWIRMLYLYPTTIGDDVLEAMAESEKVVQLHRPAAAARVRRRAEADEAAGHARQLRAAARPHPRRAFPASRCAPRSSSASRARPTTTSPSLRLRHGASGSTTSASSPTRTRRGPRRTGWPTTCRRAIKRQRQRG